MKKSASPIKKISRFPSSKSEQRRFVAQGVQMVESIVPKSDTKHLFFKTAEGTQMDLGVIVNGTGMDGEFPVLTVVTPDLRIIDIEIYDRKAFTAKFPPRKKK